MPEIQNQRYETWGGESLPESYFIIFTCDRTSADGSGVISIGLCVDDESDIAGEYVSTGGGTWRCWAREDFEVGDPETIACRMFRDTDPSDAPEFQDWLQSQQSHSR